MAATTVEVLLRSVGGPAGGGAAGAMPKNGDEGMDKQTPDTKVLQQIFGGVKKFVKGQLGLNFGVGALVKQSQIFTSTVGVIFQLLGALVDVILAPFLPIIIPIIRILGKAVPHISNWMQKHIAPAVNKIVEWIVKFEGKWDRSWAMLTGPEGLGQLITKFNSWWSSTASPWLGEQIGLLAEGVKEKLAGMWDWFMEQPGRLQGWITTFMITQVEKLPGYLATIGKIIWALILEAGKFALKLPFILGNMIGGLVKMLFPVIGHLVVALIKGAWTIISFLIKSVAKLAYNIVKTIINQLLAPFKWLWSKVGGFFGGLWTKVLKFAEAKLTKLPFGLGKVFKGLSTGGLGTTLGKIAKASRAIPYIGAAATLGFGAVETVKAYQKYGAAGALAFGTKTLAATALQATGASAGGLAVDVLGSAILHKKFSEDKGIQVNIFGETVQEKNQKQNKEKVNGETVANIYVDEVF